MIEMVLFLLAFCIFMIKRNVDIYNFRVKNIRVIEGFLKRNVDVLESDDIQKWCDKLNEVSSWTMLFKFWKPLKLEEWYEKEFIDLITRQD